jgi:hypothetical protein
MHISIISILHAYNSTSLHEYINYLSEVNINNNKHGVECDNSESSNIDISKADHGN